MKIKNKHCSFCVKTKKDETQADGLSRYCKICPRCDEEKRISKFNHYGNSNKTRVKQCRSWYEVKSYSNKCVKFIYGLSVVSLIKECENANRL